MKGTLKPHSQNIIEPTTEEVRSRFDEFARLQDGWLDGLGLAPSKDGLCWLAAAWEKWYPHNLPNPFAYPTPEGGIQLEWTLGLWELSADIHLTSHQASLRAVNVGTEESAEALVELEFPAGWQRLGTFIRARVLA